MVKYTKIAYYTGTYVILLSKLAFSVNASAAFD